jgi:hypothetical protein
MTILAQVVDPDGRRIELTVERRDHIVDDHDGHPELDAYLADVMLAVSEPHEQRPGHRDNELWYFRRNVGPSRWLQVVVAYEEERGWIVTAGQTTRELSSAEWLIATARLRRCIGSHQSATEPKTALNSRLRKRGSRCLTLLHRADRCQQASAPRRGFSEDEGRVILRLGPCVCLTAGVPGGNLGGFWIRR